MSNSNPMTQGNGKKPTILQYLDTYKDQVAAALPNHVTPDRMVRIVTTSIRKNPELTQCNPQSLFGAIIQASQLGLEPDNSLGHAYLVPFRNRQQKTKDVQLIIGYRGFLDLAWRSQKVVGIDAEVVYEKDHFRYTRGLHPTLEHTPSEDEDRGERTHAYCIFHLRDGGKVWRVLTRNDVMAAKEFSAAAKSGPWVTHEDDMWRKTAVRATAKYAPLSIELQRAVGVDEQSEAGKFDTARVIDGNFMPISEPENGDGESADDKEPQTKTEKVRQQLADRQQSQGDESEQPEPEQSSDNEQPQDGAPTEGDVFALIENAQSMDDLNAAAAASDAISTASMPKFRKMLGDKSDELREAS